MAYLFTGSPFTRLISSYHLFQISFDEIDLLPMQQKKGISNVNNGDFDLGRSKWLKVTFERCQGGPFN